MSFDVVVAADLDWGIGNASGLPWPRLPGDLAHFKRTTLGGAIIMGRKTWESVEVGGRPLPKRVNLVISRQPLAVPDGVIVAASLEAALAASPGDRACFVVGGAAIYRIAFDHAALRYVYLTRVAGRFACDTQIPDLDAAGFVTDPTWDGACEATENAVAYRIERLVRPRRGT